MTRKETATNGPETANLRRKLGLFQTSCVKYIEDVVEILENLIDRPRQKQ
jgi:hypothetical protein